MKKRLLAVHALLLGSVYAFAQCVAPAPPTSVSATPNSFCSNTAVNTNLNATSAGNQIAWYTVPTGGTAIGTSPSGVNFPVTLSTTTTYYAEALAGGGTVVNTYLYTGTTQTFTVPAGITAVNIEVWGGQGNSNALGVVGGLGGYATGTLAVNGGDILYIEVGNGGTTVIAGGYNGGGNGGNGGCATAYAGGGGGASDVRYNVNSLGARVIVGAGGGGAAGNRVAGCGRGNGGGGGGGYFGGGGGAAWPSGSVVVPTGGTQSAGGSGGTSTYTTLNPTNNGQAGASGIGGNGGLENSSNQAGSQAATSGGTGGGATGSNGTYAGNFAGQSGAGGSSYIGGVTAGSTTAGLRAGSGQVRITYIDICPSASRVPVTVTINPIPVLTITANPGTTVCSGSQVTLSGSGAQAYGWSGPTQVYDNTPFVIGMGDAGLYTVIGVDTTTGCSSTDTITLAVLQSPAVTATASDPFICINDTVILTASGGNSYSWSSGGTNATEVVIPSGTTAYTVTGLDSSNGCTTTDTVLVTVNPNPTVVATATNNIICVGDATTMTATGAVTYTWSSGGTNATEIVSPVNTTPYIVMGTDSAGCMGSDTLIITVNPLPVVTATAGANNICSGTAVTMTATGANSYTWSSGGTAATETVTPSTTTSYVVTGLDSLTACTNMDTITITVLPSPAVVASGNSPICAGSSATLTASGANSFVWSSGGTNATEIVTPATTTAYTVTGTDSSGCSGTDTITVVVNPLPVVTLSIPVGLVCVDDGSFALTGGSPSGGTWSGNGVSGGSFSPTTAGVGSQLITYTFTDGNGCMNTATDNIDVSACIGINGPEAANLFTFYPNPATSFITLKWGTNLQVKQLEVTDLTGRTVMTEAVSAGSNTAELNISTLPVGIYNLKVVTATDAKVYRIVKN